VSGIKIPFIGDVLSGNPAVQFIANLRSELLGPLANTLRANTGDLQSLMDQIVDVLNSAFGTEVQGGIGGITGVTGTVSGANEHFVEARPISPGEIVGILIIRVACETLGCLSKNNGSRQAFVSHQMSTETYVLFVAIYRCQ
jgi:hypothetical protein